MIGIYQETEEQKRNAKKLGIETISMIDDNGTFINPDVENKIENWGYRGALLEKYRELKKLLE